MQWPGGRILQRHELDAFLAQAVSSQLYEPDQLQELKVRCFPTPSESDRIDTQVERFHLELSFILILCAFYIGLLHLRRSR